MNNTKIIQHPESGLSQTNETEFQKNPAFTGEENTRIRSIFEEAYSILMEYEQELEQTGDIEAMKDLIEMLELLNPQLAEIIKDEIEKRRLKKQTEKKLKEQTQFIFNHYNNRERAA